MTFHALCEVGSNCVGQQAESQSDMAAHSCSEMDLLQVNRRASSDRARAFVDYKFWIAF